jgi:alcohol dehydrogenase
VRTRAAVLRASGAPRPYVRSRPLEIIEIDLDPPGQGEILVRMRAAGVCHSDLSVIDGNRPRPLPMALGHEAAGEVVELGAGVDEFVVGDHVVLVFLASCGSCEPCVAGHPTLCGPGAAANGAGTLLHGARRLHDLDGALLNHHLGVSGFSDYAVVSKHSAVRVSDSVPFTLAALFGCAMSTGFGAVHNTARVRPGESVAVMGLGGVGLASVLGAVVAGAAPIIAIDPVAAKRELALSLGATHACDPTDAAAVVREATGGGARWVFEAVGSAAVMAQAFALTGRGGTTVASGLPAPGAELVLPALSFISDAKTFTGSYMGSAHPQRDIPAMIELWQAGRLPVEKLLSSTLVLDDVNEAMDALADGTAVRQVVVWE